MAAAALATAATVKRPRLCFFAVLLVAACAATAASSRAREAEQQPASAEASSQLQFDVVVAHPGPLGVQLNADLSIRAITPAARALNEQHGVRAGDRIVALNGAPLPRNMGLAAFQQLLADTPRPMYLTIHPSDDQPRYSVASAPLTRAEATMIDAATVRLVETLTNSEVLSVPATLAEFSTRSTCKALPLIVVTPFDGCGHFSRNVSCAKTRTTHSRL